MTYISCSVQERFVNPLFEVFDGGDFVLSSYRDIEEPLTRIQIFLHRGNRALHFLTLSLPPLLRTLCPRRFDWLPVFL